MILRKPYAFLIKHFKKINLLLLILILFIYNNATKFSKFAKNYVNDGFYNETIDSISNYANTYMYIAFILVLVISVVLIVLLKKKDKPFIAYAYIVVTNVYNLVILVYSDNYFTYKAMDGFKLVTAKVISDLSFIGTLFYYPILIILVIRALGIDLKSFGFQEDKEFLEATEIDREEVEVEVQFDKEKWIRKVKYYFRTTKYFVLEHLIPVSAILAIVLFIGIRNVYDYIFVDNKIYTMNEVVESNNYNLRVKHTYLTDKDYAGNVIRKDGSYFVVVDLEIGNKLSSNRNFDIEKMLLFVNDDFYVPLTKYNNHFKDMGNLYTGDPIKPNETVSYLLIYQVPKPDKDANFVLKYQDLTGKERNGKLLQIKVKVVDISKFKDKGLAHYTEDMSVPINEKNKMVFRISKYEIGATTNYIYQSCGSNGRCPIYEATYNAPASNRVMHLKFSLDEQETEDFMDFVNSYAKIRYVVGEETKEVKIKHAITRKYQGNHLYLVVPEEIENASRIELVFTIRSYRYIYRLKGE